MPFTGFMISFATWEKFIRLSTGSDAMKDRVINRVVQRLGRPEFLDSFELGLVLGELSTSLTLGERRDWLATIHLTRDTSNVPIVKAPN